ncbi:M24 family metallopeptidase [Christensenellaceae bacterium OttesenSCG-928-K19]|nr:M24 family metallopeptidase [Christensenellaceae bacterium OttesenSCG-928-K19]
MSRKAVLDKVGDPGISLPKKQAIVPKEVYQARHKAMLEQMKAQRMDAVVIYADREHYSNFKYFTGFDPRFEEAALVLHQDGAAYILLGNECYGMYATSQIDVKPIACQAFSLPNQPMETFTSFEDVFTQAGLAGKKKIGMIGWKLFTPAFGEGYKTMYCVPSFIVEGIAKIAGKDALINATAMLVDAQDGLRCVNEAVQIAAFEYGAAYASNGVMQAWKALEPGLTERQVAENLKSYGLVYSCHPVVSIGENTKRGMISPTDYAIQKGDPINIVMGLEGGLTCRNGYLAADKEELPEGSKDYIEEYVLPYYFAVAAWYEMIGIGTPGGDIYAKMEELIPKEKFGWTLNNGHLCATEEWLSSPIWKGSKVPIKSGMIVQMDIIPFGAPIPPNVEDGICIADAALRDEIKAGFPDVWERMQQRRDYMQGTLGIRLKEEVLPMSNLAGLYRPLALNRELGLKITE